MLQNTYKIYTIPNTYSYIPQKLPFSFFSVHLFITVVLLIHF